MSGEPSSPPRRSPPPSTQYSTSPSIGGGSSERGRTRCRRRPTPSTTAICQCTDAAPLTIAPRPQSPQPIVRGIVTAQCWTLPPVLAGILLRVCLCLAERATDAPPAQPDAATVARCQRGDFPLFNRSESLATGRVAANRVTPGVRVQHALRHAVDLKIPMLISGARLDPESEHTQPVREHGSAGGPDLPYHGLLEQRVIVRRAQTA